MTVDGVVIVDGVVNIDDFVIVDGVVIVDDVVIVDELAVVQEVDARVRMETDRSLRFGVVVGVHSKLVGAE